MFSSGTPSTGDPAKDCIHHRRDLSGSGGTLKVCNLSLGVPKVRDFSPPTNNSVVLGRTGLNVFKEKTE